MEKYVSFANVVPKVVEFEIVIRYRDTCAILGAFQFIEKENLVSLEMHYWQSKVYVHNIR